MTMQEVILKVGDDPFRGQLSVSFRREGNSICVRITDVNGALLAGPTPLGIAAEWLQEVLVIE